MVVPKGQVERLAYISKFIEETTKSGNFVSGAGLQPSSAGARVRLESGKITVMDGPFTETKELIAGYWIWQVRSMDEAVEWARRCPNPMPGEERLRAEIERKNKS